MALYALSKAPTKEFCAPVLSLFFHFFFRRISAAMRRLDFVRAQPATPTTPKTVVRARVLTRSALSGFVRGRPVSDAQRRRVEGVAGAIRHRSHGQRDQLLPHGLGWPRQLET